MQSQDQFARGLTVTTARLTARADGLRDVADVDVEATPTYWRLVLTPKTQGACPLEMVIDPAAQTMDLQIGPDTFEQVAIERLDDLDEMVAAIVEGRSSRRTAASAASGAPLWAETIIPQGPGRVWRRRRSSPAGERLARVTVVEREHTWLPYRR